MLKRFLRDRSGNFGVAFGVMALAAVSVVGGTIDISDQQRQKTELQNLVDAATLAGAALAMQGASIPDQRQEISRYFNQDCSAADCIDLMGVTMQVTPEFIEVEANAQSKTHFMAMVGVDGLGMQAKARVNLGRTHLEVHLVLDNTASMNIVDGLSNIRSFRGQFQPYLDSTGSTDTCAFACHSTVDGTNTSVTSGGRTGAEIARSLGYALREDRVKTEMIAQANRLLTPENRRKVKIAVHDFDWWANMRQVPTNDIARVRTAINAVTNVSSGTQYEKMVPILLGNVGPSGTGATERDAKKSIVLITDGIHQRLSDSKPELIPLSVCDDLKADGRELYVLNMRYPDPREIGSGIFEAKDIVESFIDDIPDRLRACASPDRYFEAEYGATVTNAMDALTEDLLRSNKIYLAM